MVTRRGDCLLAVVRATTEDDKKRTREVQEKKTRKKKGDASGGGLPWRTVQVAAQALLALYTSRLRGAVVIGLRRSREAQACSSPLHVGHDAHRRLQSLGPEVAPSPTLLDTHCSLLR